ncbi:Tn3 family transposase [Nocardia sp. NPDC023852]|uniref:Tn3 family transposase n=1 Tax=Nocardia sp. NPDC023852 TaxID=3154697 RepID=UPI0033E3A701
MCRVVVSIHACEVSAHDVTRMISRDGDPTPLGQAIAHYGRTSRPCTSCAWPTTNRIAGKARPKPTSERAATTWRGGSITGRKGR